MSAMRLVKRWIAVAFVLALVEHTERAVDDPPPPLLVASKHFVYAIVYDPAFSAVVTARGESEKTTEPRQLPKLPIDMTGKRIHHVAVGRWFDDGLALALCIQNGHTFEYYRATMLAPVNEPDPKPWNPDPKVWMVARIDLSTPDSESPYHAAYVQNPESDTLRIQWERVVKLDDRKLDVDWLLYVNYCPIGDVDPPGRIHRLGVSEIPSAEPAAR